ncbi:hypothetical protein BH10ACT7_BH10ACT7_29600 [soil metagenome]
MNTPFDFGPLAAALEGEVADHPLAEALVTPLSAADVAATIAFAQRRALRVAAVGPARIDLAGTILVSTERLCGIAVDEPARRVTIGAGDTWESVTGSLAPCGLGVRRFGAAASSVTAVEVVTGDAVVRHASETENPELFWAVRNGGSGFGIVTAFELEAFPLDVLDTAAVTWHPQYDAAALALFRSVKQSVDPTNLIMSSNWLG